MIRVGWLEISWAGMGELASSSVASSILQDSSSSQKGPWDAPNLQVLPVSSGRDILSLYFNPIPHICLGHGYFCSWQSARQATSFWKPQSVLNIHQGASSTTFSYIQSTKPMLIGLIHLIKTFRNAAQSFLHQIVTRQVLCYVQSILWANVDLHSQVQSNENTLLYLTSLVAQIGKNPLAMRETWVRSLDWEDPLEEGMATHSSTLVWRIPMDRKTWWATVLQSQIWLSH